MKHQTNIYVKRNNFKKIAPLKTNDIYLFQEEMLHIVEDVRNLSYREKEIKIRFPNLQNFLFLQVHTLRK